MNRIFHGRTRILPTGILGASLLFLSALILFQALPDPTCGFEADCLKAKVYNLPRQALRNQFPEASIRRKSKFLSKGTRNRLQEKLGFPIGRFHTFYIAGKAGKVMGYGIFDTHRVRTKNETLFIVIDANGSVRHVEIISFFEPEEYIVPKRWLNLFRGKSEGLYPGVDLPAISGATLTVNAVSRAVRKVLALQKFHFGED